MRIAEAKTWAVANPDPQRGGPCWVFVRLTTDDGVAGYGEAYGVPFAPSRVRALIEDVAERHVVGRSPFDVEAISRVVYSSGYSRRPGLTTGGVLSAIEIACQDIAGKALGQPIYNLLGGRVQERLRSYTYLYPRAAAADGMAYADAFGDPDAAPERLAEYAAMGFTAVGYDPLMPYGAFDPRQPSLAALDNAEAVTRRMRDAAGSGCDLLLKLHGQLTPAGAIRLARRLEPFDPLWIEEPVPPEDVEATAIVARATSIPIASGERLATRYEFAALLAARAAAILQPAPARAGGILETKKIAAMGEAWYADLAPHLYAGPIEAAANIQLGACSPNFLIQESIESFGGFHAELLTQPIEWEDGYIIPSDRPGLGHELDEAVADAHPCECDDVFPRMAETPVPTA